ncbi:MAG: sugar ABC transporter permease, partial [Spirochaetota bacterium]|nr:sugar ABC transporter permease [Spirochaetota bacterium]
MYCSQKDKRLAIIMLIPFLAVLFLFVYGFIFWSVRVSFSAWDSILPDMTWVGMRNYQELMGSLRFKTDIVNTIYFTIFFIAICVVGGFILSYLLFVNLKGEGFFRTVYLFPLSLSFVVTGVLWRWIFNPEVGLNALL